MFNRKPCRIGLILACIKCLIFYVFVLNSFFDTIVSADEWVSPTLQETFSENGDYIFQVTPAFDSQAGTCKGMLFAKNGKKIKLLWERPLVNNVCPIKTLVSNSGKFIITFGDWYRYEKLPIVVYGVQGRLINVYGELAQIIPFYTGEAAHGFATGIGLPDSIGGRHWLSSSLLLFDPNEDFFIVRMSNKEILVFETNSGRLIEDTWKKLYTNSDQIKKYDDLKKNLGRFIVIKALKLASADQTEEHEIGVFVLNQCKNRDSIDIIKEALKDPTSKIISASKGKVREYPIRKAASEALKSIGEKIPENVVTEERVEEE